MQKLKEGVRAIVDKLYDRMYEYGTKRGWLPYNEMLTRYILIDPVLRGLGWNIENPNVVRIHESISLRKSDNKVHPDYTLYDKGKAVAFIEAKSWGTMSGINKKVEQEEKIRIIMRTKPVNQLIRYCKGCREHDKPLGILTDGGSWWLCDFRKRKFEDRVKGIDLGKHKPEEVVSFLLQLRPGRISDLLKE